MTITVIDVMRRMGIEITNELSWSVGAQARERWMDQGRKAPDLKLTPKTNGGGSHCLAHYPESFEAEIRGILAAYRAERARQGELDL